MQNFCLRLLLAAVFVSSPVIQSQEENTPALVREFAAEVLACRADGERRAAVTRFIEALGGRRLPWIEGPTATFIYVDGAGEGGPRPIEIFGDFSGWERAHPMQRVEGTPVYFFTLAEIPETARIEYLFKVGGEALMDPQNPGKIDNGVGGENSFFAMPSYRPLVLPEEDFPAGTVQTVELASAILNNHRPVHVYTPPLYGEGRRYPVLYVHDGTNYLYRGQLAQIADYLIHAGQIRPLIIVFVDPVERHQEYARGKEYTRLVMEELLPYIRQNFRVSDNPLETGVMGASMGGLIAVHLAFAHPDTFGMAASQSGAFGGLSDTILPEIYTAEKKKVKIYLDVGLYDLSNENASLLDGNRLLSQLLQEKQYEYRYAEFPGGHNWTCWRDQLPAILTYLYPAESEKSR